MVLLPAHERVVGGIAAHAFADDAIAPFVVVSVFGAVAFERFGLATTGCRG